MDVQDYDYVVVGAGSAGCIIAARVSEDTENRVLLIEAGPDNRDWRIDMPLAVKQLLTGTKYNWGFVSEPEPGIGHRSVNHPRGKVIGGSSSINGMVYTRGHPRDYDDWRDVHGCAGWGYADVLPYFRRMETGPRGGNRYRGGDGPVRPTFPAIDNPLNVAFLDAGRELGYPFSDDLNGCQQEGFSVAEMSIHRGRRSSAGRAFLTPAVRARPNLTIVTHSVVERVLFSDRRAVGIRYQRDGRSVEARSHREVVLSAGAIGTPHLLLCSGVGPAVDLRHHGVEVVLDQPQVGENLQDHADVLIRYRCSKPVSLYRHSRGWRRVKVGMEWFLRKQGLATSNQFEACAYIRSRAGLDRPNIKFEFFPLALSPDEFKPYPFESFQMHMTLENSVSRGRLSITSPGVRVSPSLRFNYLQDERDLQALREAVHLARELIATPAFDGLRGPEIDPGDTVRSEAELNAWLRQRMTSAYHPSCTCRMGRSDDPKAVVGPDLRVHGLDGIRIADASIMPTVVNANLNATCLMIGERAADFVLRRPQLAPDNAPYWTNPDWEAEQRRAPAGNLGEVAD